MEGQAGGASQPPKISRQRVRLDPKLYIAHQFFCPTAGRKSFQASEKLALEIVRGCSWQTCCLLFSMAPH